MISTTYYQSPVGMLEIVASDSGIKSLRFTTKGNPENKPANPVLKECLTQLDEYFHGERKRFYLKLDLSDQTSFHREVYRLVQTIPYGRTRSYSDIARTMGNAGASRAVGQANSHNPLPIIIPCHRVIDKDGGLRGYVYGLKMKQALLELENPAKFHHQTALFEG